MFLINIGILLRLKHMVNAPSQETSFVKLLLLTPPAAPAPACLVVNSLHAMAQQRLKC